MSTRKGYSTGFTRRFWCTLWCSDDIPELRKSELPQLASLGVFLPHVLRPKSTPVYVVLEVVANDVRFLKEQPHAVRIESAKQQGISS